MSPDHDQSRGGTNRDVPLFVPSSTLTPTPDHAGDVPSSGVLTVNTDDVVPPKNRVTRIHSWAPGGSPFPTSGHEGFKESGGGAGSAPIGREWGSPSSEPQSPEELSPRGRPKTSGSISIGGAGASMLPSWVSGDSLELKWFSFGSQFPVAVSRGSFPFHSQRACPLGGSWGGEGEDEDEVGWEFQSVEIDLNTRFLLLWLSLVEEWRRGKRFPSVKPCHPPLRCVLMNTPTRLSCVLVATTP